MGAGGNVDKKTKKTTTQSTNMAPSAGENGVALAPPAYGIGLLDIPTYPPVLQASDTRAGDTKSQTSLIYSIQDVMKHLATYNLGPYKGSDLIKALKAGAWRIVFWKEKGHLPLTDSNVKIIFLSPEEELIKNVETLFHEAIHAIHPTPGAVRSSSVWINLEDEINAQYQEILFLQANSRIEPQLVKNSEFSEDWETLKKMNQNELFYYFKEHLMPEIIMGKLMSRNQDQYNKELLTPFGGDLIEFLKSPEVEAMLERVIYNFHRGTYELPNIEL